ncbi:MAG: phosphate/phosphite/phosphonate ABC transporter substrate-binding protein [Magnetococcales bacterium]|nr:phosphate/phosphite/phosphonate ABC transporter substrate-binding protein [Magnetococcales bacterium]
MDEPLEPKRYAFGVLPQRSAVLTAQYWNPILDFVSRESGVTLILKTARTAPEANQAMERGEYDFVYSNTIFLPRLSGSGYRVILKPRSAAIRGQIVTREESSVHALKELQDQTVGFPTRGAFVGYAVPMDHLMRSGIEVKSTFGGNQEGIMGQLMAGKVVAAGVNNELMRLFAQRENFRYRVLWESDPFENLPISVHARVPREVASAVQRAFVAMNDLPEGISTQEKSAIVIKQSPPYGFTTASQGDYQNYIDFYQNTLVRDIE